MFKTLKQNLVLFGLFVYCNLMAVVLYAQEAAPAAGPIPGVDGATNFLANPASWIVMGLGVGLELLMRFMPTEKPKSIIMLVSGGARQLGKFLLAAADFLDKYVVSKFQNLKQ